MDKRIRIIQISLIVACVIFVSSTAFLFIAKQIIKKDRISLQKKIQELSLDKEKTVETMEKLEESKSTIEQKLKNSEDLIVELSLQLNEQKRKSSQISDKIKEGELEIEKLKTDIATHQKEKRDLLRLLKSLNKAFNEMKEDYGELAETKEKSSERIEKLNKKLENLSRKGGATSLGTVVIKR